MFSTLIERIEEEGEDEMAARGAVASGYLGECGLFSPRFLRCLISAGTSRQVAQIR